MSFFCHGCGLCCAHVKQRLESKNRASSRYKKLLDEFPYKAKDDGSCEMLNENNHCQVYENRPTICNMEKMKVIFDPLSSDKQYYTDQEGYCKDLMLQDGWIQKDIDLLYQAQRKKE